MAQAVYWDLTMLGQQVAGESTVSSLERADKIECASFSWGVTTPREGASAQITGRRMHKPVTIIKRVDKSSPVLFKGLCRNEKIDSAKFWFFRPSPTGSGEEQKYMTVELSNAYISSINLVSEDATRSKVEQPTAMEEVQIVFQDITVTYEDGGVTHTDSWSGEA